MKHILLFAAFALLGQALASTTVSIAVDASVSNVCVFLGHPLAQVQEVPSLPQTVYTVQCTSGTHLTGDPGPQGIALLPVLPSGELQAVQYRGQQDITAISGRGDTYTWMLAFEPAPREASTPAPVVLTFSVDYN